MCTVYKKICLPLLLYPVAASQFSLQRRACPLYAKHPPDVAMENSSLSRPQTKSGETVLCNLVQAGESPPKSSAGVVVLAAAADLRTSRLRLFPWLSVYLIRGCTFAESTSGTYILRGERFDCLLSYMNIK